MNHIAENLLHVNSRIQRACEIAKRARKDVSLVAVSKTHPADMVRAAYKSGQIAFGENYVQEGIDKIEALQDIRQRITWHFIGPIQSNKTRFIAESFDWVQSVDRLKIAQRLSEQRPRKLTNLNICLQVNISGESSKSGVSPGAALLTCLDLVELPNLSLRGLMAIPEPGASLQSMKEFYELFIEIQKNLKKHQFKTPFDTLSIGMSDDLEQSIQAGSTMVRIGTAIFGARNIKEQKEDLNSEQ
jgi:pyridoxal phosphate enzyme (YggS family)